VSEFEFVFVLLLAAAGLVRLAQFAHVPYPIALVLGGLTDLTPEKWSRDTEICLSRVKISATAVS